ncbi:hypothetical protein DJ56_4284 [Yersinia pestis]|nr:hypothetical protein DJ56_4284 [Yersinia pestis]
MARHFRARAKGPLWNDNHDNPPLRRSSLLQSSLLQITMTVITTTTTNHHHHHYSAIKLTCAATIRQPHGNLTHVCIWRPTRVLPSR